ncbi:hypothetical protein MAR_034746 [Mya arenaria]|uniref:Uncharacterized protein n=1 Tax=Mya arenaria TaxID=6604 RepID=A0ABY7EKG7_MYAAR|nr:hypothetical protein MAR_034746 [Mya arenaria]
MCPMHLYLNIHTVLTVSGVCVCLLKYKYNLPVEGTPESARTAAQAAQLLDDYQTLTCSQTIPGVQESFFTSKLSMKVHNIGWKWNSKSKWSQGLSSNSPMDDDSTPDELEVLERLESRIKYTAKKFKASQPLIFRCLLAAAENLAESMMNLATYDMEVWMTLASVKEPSDGKDSPGLKQRVRQDGENLYIGAALRSHSLPLHCKLTIARLRRPRSTPAQVWNKGDQELHLLKSETPETKKYTSSSLKHQKPRSTPAQV